MVGEEGVKDHGFGLSAGYGRHLADVVVGVSTNVERRAVQHVERIQLTTVTKLGPGKLHGHFIGDQASERVAGQSEEAVRAFLHDFLTQRQKRSKKLPLDDENKMVNIENRPFQNVMNSTTE